MRGYAPIFYKTAVLVEVKIAISAVRTQSPECCKSEQKIEISLFFGMNWFSIIIIKFGILEPLVIAFS